MLYQASGCSESGHEARIPCDIQIESSFLLSEVFIGNARAIIHPVTFTVVKLQSPICIVEAGVDLTWQVEA